MGFRIPPSVKVLLSKGSASFDLNTGIATVLIKIPADSRVISGGHAWHENPASGDYLTADVIDYDDVLGNGYAAVLDTFVDSDVPVNNRGWYFSKDGTISLRPLVTDDPRELPGGGLFYLRIQAFKVSPAADTFYVNLLWGVRLR